LTEERNKSSEDSQKAKKKTVKKRSTKQHAELKKIKEENMQLKDQLLRKAAEFDNYRKRTERDFLDRIQNSNQRLITDLLPVLDDFERSLDHAKEAENSDALIEGFELIYKKMSSLLAKEGLKPIEAVGQEFDPDQHDALMQMDSDSHESGTIIEEHLKGYHLNDKVIRHSQVLVAK
jgi:molecular chaperone GrpE